MINRENTDSFLWGMPYDIWHQVFDNLSHKKIFFTLPQVSHSCNIIVKNYWTRYAEQENYWKNRCLEEKYGLWGGNEIELIEKKPFLSWKKVYLASEPSYYIYKKRKYQYKKLQSKNKINSINIKNFSGVCAIMKNYLFYDNINLIDKYTAKIKEIEKKEEIIIHNSNIEKTIVSAIGIKQFAQIPLFEKCLQNKNLNLLDDIDYLIEQYINDKTFPTIVRGQTQSGLKFLFIHPKEINKKEERYSFIYSRNNSMINFDYTFYPYSSDTVCFSVGKGIHSNTIEMLQSFVKTGYYEYQQKELKLYLDFTWK